MSSHTGSAIAPEEPLNWPAAVLAAVIAVPSLGVVWSAGAEALYLDVWKALGSDPQLMPALAMTLWTGLAATVFSVAFTALILSLTFPGPRWERAVKFLAPMLAVPHAAFAIGLAFLVAPSGWILRAISPWATGFDAPPPWATTQDAWGLGLIAVLVAKEVPFLLWAAATQLRRLDTAARWTRELQVAASMGYAPRRAWWRIVWPQLWPRLAAPMLAVLAYSLSVVDMALVIGPTTPPTLAVLAWQWLLDADAAINAQGAATAWLLALLVVLLTGGLWMLPRLMHWRSRWVNGRRGDAGGGVRQVAGLPLFALIALTLLPAIYALVMLALLVGSVSGVWPFPRLLPETFSGQGWQSVAASASTVWTTSTLGLASSLTALAWSLAWLECASPQRDAQLRRLLYLPLLLPSVLWVVGLHRLMLAWGLDGRWAGLWIAHSLAATPYVLIALSPAYLSFDKRYSQIAASLQKSRWRFLLRIKWPLLKASISGALAVGFAVSVAQYLPTLFIGAGRFTTVTTEAVTLASGAQRSLTAAYAWLQWLLPAVLFGIAAWAGRPRRFSKVTT